LEVHMNHPESHRLTVLALLAVAFAEVLLGCSDDNHGPTIGAPTGPVVIVEGGGSGPTSGGGASGTGTNGGATSIGGSNLAGGFDAGGGVAGLLGAAGTDPFGTAGTGIGPFGAAGTGIGQFGAAGTSPSFGGSF
jgi:hypothetical protein